MYKFWTIVLSLLGIFATILTFWWLYRKSYTNQQMKYIELAVIECKRAGTPVKVIDSFDDITRLEKADIYDAVMMRVKGRLGKSNKYRNGT